VPAEHASEQLYHPGEHAPVSGVYEVIHRVHRDAHQVLIIRGEELPPCRVCHGQVRFCLASAVDHLTHDWDLAGPTLQLVTAPRRAKATPESV